MHCNGLLSRIVRSVGTAAAAAIVVGCGTTEPAKPPKPPEVTPARAVGAAPSSKKHESTAAVSEGMPNLKFVQKGVTLRWIEKNKNGMTAIARKFEGNEVTRKGVLVDFSAELFQDGKLTSSVTAPKVVADEANRTLTAAGGVTLKSLDRGTVVTCEWIKWSARENKIVGNGGVRVVSNVGGGDRYEMEGAAFEADTALKTLKIMNSPKGLVQK